MKVEFASPAQVDHLWPHCSAFLQKGIDATSNDLSIGWLWTLCRSGNGFLMIGCDEYDIKMAAVWRFGEWDEPVFECLVAGGEDMSHWIDSAVIAAKETAKLGGSNCLVMKGRSGWSRVFPNAKPIYTAYEMRV